MSRQRHHRRPASRRLSIVAAGLVILALSRPAAAGLQSGVAAYDGGEFVAAYRELYPLAEQGDAVAAYLVSRMLFSGHGIARNPEAALKWLRLAAEKGESNAQIQLASRYELGSGLPQSDRDAFDWYKRAASQGAPVAQLNLGILYADGRGVAADPVLAHMWLNLGAAALPPGAVRNSAARLRDTVTARLTPEQTATAHRLARDWKPTPPTPQK